MTETSIEETELYGHTLNEQLRPKLQTMVNRCFTEYGVSNFRELVEKGDEGIKAGIYLVEQMVQISSEAARNSILPTGDVASETHKLLMPTKETKRTNQD